MKKPPVLFFLLLGILFCSSAHSQSTVVAGRTNELFLKTDLVPGSANLSEPWEITYGPDDSLWITEAKGYRVRKVHPVNGGRRTVLNLRDDGTFSPSSYRRTFNDDQNPWPQGGMMGLAIHPDYNHPTNAKKYVYVAYVRHYQGNNQTVNGELVRGRLFWTNLVRFEYISGQLRSPVLMCDTIRGSNDHNSGRMIIAPVNGVNYLFYAVGDLGGGQFDNHYRVNKAGLPESYEGKILRFNLEIDGDASQSPVQYNRWIPNDNPFNAQLGRQSAVWSTGIRNNQGFAYNPQTDKLYGSSHGPHSDDEINVIERAMNYGHPTVIGFAADENYVASSAGKPGSSLPVIGSEMANKDVIGASYRDPIHTAYASTQSHINYIYNGGVPNHGLWPSEGWSGLGIDTSTIIPGGKNSLLAASLKWGRVMRLKLNDAGDAIVNIGDADTASYFGSRNRFRDIALSPDARHWYVVMDRNPTSSGPTANNPIVPDCAGCIQRYTFLGYKRSMVAGANERSTMPTFIPVSTGAPNMVHRSRTLPVNSVNSNDTVWVPFNGPDGNIIAEVKAKMGSTAANNLGDVSVSYYRHSGAVREDAEKKLYLNRNFTINFQNTPTQPIAVRLYFTKAELDALIPALNSAGTGSGISDISTMVVRLHNNAISASLSGTTEANTPVIREEFAAGQSYVVQLLLEAPFSNQYSFFLGNPNSTLPVNLLTFKGSYQDAGNVLLQWQTTNEENAREFEIQRGVDGTNFAAIGAVAARGNGIDKTDYSYRDNNIIDQAGNTLYYRLRMVDNDGRFKYSNIITVNIPFEPGRVKVMPNPVVGTSPVKAYITSSVSTRVKWSLVDNSGRAVVESSMNVRPGSNTLDINASGLNAGIYYLVVRGEGIDQRVRIQKL